VELLTLVVLDIALVLAVSRVLRRVLERVRQPPVMAEVLAGVVLGASVLGALPGDPSAALFTPEAREVLVRLGQVGVAAYLFRVAAALDPLALRREGRAVAWVAVATFAIPWVAGALLALGLHGSVAGAPPLLPFVLFLATAVAVTALPVLARIVEDRGLADETAGRVATGAAAAQELLVWPLLALAVVLAPGGGGGRGPGAVLLLGTLALAAVLLLARAVVPWVARRAPRLAGPATLVALGLAATATELSGLHLVLGAFLFGAALPPAPRAAGVALLDTRPLALASAVLLPVFFALGAFAVDLGALGVDGLGTLVLVLAVAVGAKVGAGVWAAGRAGLPRRDAHLVGALVNARGLVELVVLAVGRDAGLIDDRLFAVMVVMALVTTLATGPAVERLRGVPAEAPRDLELAP
jgi:Kef-type K+ transport system membrane component KefB